MSKQLFVDPAEIRKAGKISFEDMPYVFFSRAAYISASTIISAIERTSAKSFKNAFVRE